MAPNNPAALMGLAQCLDSLGGEDDKEAQQTYKEVARRFPGTPFGESAKQILNRRGKQDLRKPVEGGLRPDALEYMQWALKLYDTLPPREDRRHHAGSRSPQ
jgi:hypothetical protein